MQLSLTLILCCVTGFELSFLLSVFQKDVLMPLDSLISNVYRLMDSLYAAGLLLCFQSLSGTQYRFSLQTFLTCHLTYRFHAQLNVGFYHA